VDEHTPAGEPTDAFDGPNPNEELLEDNTQTLDHAEQVDDEAFEEASAEYLGRWNRLISTTNWEKGRIISAWRAALIESDAPQQAYSDEAWARRVNNVSGQHVGRLRRVYDRFGDSYENYRGLFWSHFQAVIDWDDAEMWLEGAVQNDWSVAQMRSQRWEAMGAPEEMKPRPEDVISGDFDEDVPTTEGGAGDTIEGAVDVVRDPEADESDAGQFDDAVDSVPFDTDSPPEADPTGTPVRPFEALPQLPDDLQEAVENFKLAILAHKMTGWGDVSCDTILATLDALKQLALAPSDA